MSEDIVKAKWDKIYAQDSAEVWPVAEVLQENRHLLPKSGSALDVACGLGANALLLARQGLSTHAWDISEVAIEKLNSVALQAGLSLKAAVRDIGIQPPAEASFDVIVVAHFLDRSVIPSLIAALKPGGLIFYQTFTRAKVDDSGPSCADFRLKPNEFLIFFQSLRIVLLREEGLIGDLQQGFRNKAMVIAQKLP